jgi:undecaprenyl diphosphate synthase
MKIPQHIGIIMDGNGRWAKKRGLPRVMGHRAGTKATHAVVKACGELGVSYLTIYVFSAENWARPENEVKYLMELLVEMIHLEIEELNKNNVQLHAIGDLTQLPASTYRELMKGIEKTAGNSGLKLVLALSYGGRSEILHAAKKIAQLSVADPSFIETINEKSFGNYLFTSAYPDPELIIRTGGEQRISNFLLWQIAYAELHFTEVLWPDFDKQCLIKAIEDFSQRDRRFGKVKTTK